ncbi:hypothetical protein SOASR030_06540 [Leminorella grimontii]|uniref:Uncharacterized protein n=1 Tax=Leminorella grimontii TaxID=82981 RepID=A0AAV5N272_9GAMM|nr:hypothetical protein [Leminorella grimontii]KFC96268.1 hypothetical protein GLGR_1443 [Leminorella grimontii ATCC 33999 = DSM 5078]GKX54542.1 hypothetical protein SOASR030_06540 [Leminorella grimontii]GKX57959.1 hypothetical protein SOASR031_02740 [Leminorella grimontii]VFS58968.1 Uncharacterised protein [Leminorella grimontii]
MSNIAVGKLLINDEETIVKMPDSEIRMPIGAKRLSHFQLQHEPALAAELELGIEIVEDVIMPERKKLAGEIALTTDSAVIRRIPTLTAINSTRENYVSVEQVEDVFNQLADIVNGSPALRKAIPYDAEFTATLLIVRELLHHWNVDHIRLTEKDK